MYVYLGSISSLIQISSNIIDILCLYTLSRKLTMYLSDTSSIAQHLKNIQAQQHNYEKFSPTTQQYSNIKIINKNFRFSKHYLLETCNQHLIELIFKPVLMYVNVFSYWHYLQNYI